MLGHDLSPPSGRKDQRASDESLLNPSLIVSWDPWQVAGTWVQPLLGQHLPLLAT